MSVADIGAGGVRRRELLGGAALLGAAGALGVARSLPRDGGQVVVIFDSSMAASRILARASQAARQIDLVAEDRTNWRMLRDLGRAIPVLGYTNWSAYVTARLCLEGQGLRVISEEIDRRSGLVAWHMR